MYSQKTKKKNLNLFFVFFNIRSDKRFPKEGVCVRVKVDVFSWPTLNLFTLSSWNTISIHNKIEVLMVEWLSPKEINTETRVQTLDEAVSISHDYNQPTIFPG